VLAPAGFPPADALFTRIEAMCKEQGLSATRMNERVHGPREALAAASLRLKEINWLGDHASIEAAAAEDLPVLARVRSTRPPKPARLALEDACIAVIFDEPEEAVSPGQACVLYGADDEIRVLGGGFIAA